MIKAMDLVEVDIIGAESAQALIDFEQDVLAGQTGAIGAGAHSVKDLGGNDHLLASREILERAAENLFALADGIAIRGIEEIDAGFQRLLNERAALFLAECPLVEAAIATTIAHATKTEPRDIKPGAAHFGVLHCCLLLWVREDHSKPSP